MSVPDEIPTLPMESFVPASSSPIVNVPSFDPPMPITRNPTMSLPMPIVQPATHSTRFPNVNPSMFHTDTPHVTVFNGQQGTPIQTSAPKSSFSVPPTSSQHLP